jgi:mono/diheme cytochrome c family protein
MRHVLALCCVSVLTVGLWRGPAESGARAAGPAKPLLPETNFTSDADIREGEALFQTHCTYCHGSLGEA